MDSIQSFYNTDSKKLTQLNPPSRCQNIYFVFTLSFPNIHRWSKLFRQPGDISFFSRTDPIGEFNNISQNGSSFSLVNLQIVPSLLSLRTSPSSLRTSWHLPRTLAAALKSAQAWRSSPCAAGPATSPAPVKRSRPPARWFSKKKRISCFEN